MASSSEIRVKAGLPRPYSIFPTQERLYAVSGAYRKDSRRLVYSDRRAAHRCVLRPDGGTTHRSVLDSDGRATHRCVLRPDGRTTHRCVPGSDGRATHCSVLHPDGRTTHRSVLRTDGRTSYLRVFFSPVYSR